MTVSVSGTGVETVASSLVGGLLVGVAVGGTGVDVGRGVWVGIEVGVGVSSCGAATMVAFTMLSNVAWKATGFVRL